jgi:hypothetical protein
MKKAHGNKLRALREPLNRSIELVREEKLLITQLNDGCDQLDASGKQALDLHKLVLNTVRLQGQRLMKAKELVGHGKFVVWVQSNLVKYVPDVTRPLDRRAGKWMPRISRSTANNWMRAAAWSEANVQLFGQLRSVGQLYVLAGIMPAPDQADVKTEPTFSLAIALRYVKPLKRLRVEHVRTLPADEREKLHTEVVEAMRWLEPLAQATSPEATQYAP